MTWGDIVPAIFLIEPDLLYKVLEQENYSDNEDKCAVFCHIKARTVSFGVLGDYVIMEEVLMTFRKNGFLAVDSKEDNPEFNIDEPSSHPRITSHIFLQHMTITHPTLHIVVFYKRKADFLWASKIQMPTSDLVFGSTAGAFDNFKLREVTVDGIKLNIPNPTRHFLEQAAHSEYVECDEDQAQAFLIKYGKDNTEQAQQFRRKARQLIAKGKRVLDSLGVGSGSADIIPYTTDVDFGVWIKDYKPEIVDAMEKAGLQLKHLFGKVSDSYELSFKAGDIKLDMFFFYEEGNTMWNGGTEASTGKKFKYVFPSFKLCWTSFLDLRVRVPCPSLPYIKANYGEGWSTPVKTWNWKSSPPNSRPNGQWPKAEMNKVVQVFE
ncbi:hypothetical protein FSP39_018499 [Pinctada imbricata]|uniref:Ribitol-5-phosphate transferase FKTN N-terminal domain-containing protein n=1 Tax=Pinctada imbricata TaxID=66713 RepID=A0AA89BQ60_PINIB|nr:hypothetical protein FSP39_018499 [Pinctada imbricata]